MAALSAFARENLFIGLVAAAVILTVAYAVFRVLKARAQNRRRASWRAQRTEEDRIWNARPGKD